MEFESEADVATVVDTVGPLLPVQQPTQGASTTDSQADLKRTLLAEDRCVGPAGYNLC